MREDLLFGHDEIHGDVMGQRIDRVHFLTCEPDADAQGVCLREITIIIPRAMAQPAAGRIYPTAKLITAEENTWRLGKLLPWVSL